MLNRSFMYALLLATSLVSLNACLGGGNRRRDRDMQNARGPGGGGGGGGAGGRRQVPENRRSNDSGNPFFRSMGDPNHSGFGAAFPNDVTAGGFEDTHGDGRGRSRDTLVGPLQANSFRTPVPENRGPGVVIGKVNANAPNVPAMTPEKWAVLVEENNKLKKKPFPVPVVASGAVGDEPPSALALQAVKRCMECHDSRSGRHLRFDADPAKAVAGLKALIGKPTGVSWFKVTEMIRSSRFAGLPKDQENALLAYLTGQSRSHTTDELYAQINRTVLQGVTKPTEILPGSEKPLYRQLLSQIKTENPVLNAILSDPALTIYDDGLRRVYQDGGSQDVVGAHHEDGSILQSWKLADGSPMFPNGRMFGPLGSGFGTTPDSKNFKFIWRPRENGEIIPDRLRVDPYRDSNSSGPPGELVDAQHPVGTIFGEVVYEDGVVKDIRIREVAPGLRTQSTAYRLFNEAGEMKEAVRALAEQRPDWRRELAPLEAHLASNRTITPGPAIRDDYYSPVIDAPGYRDVLPRLRPEQEQELSRNRVFTSSLGKEWKRDGDHVVYAPTAQGTSRLAARALNHHGIAVDSDSCMRCHTAAGTNFAFYAPGARNTTTGASNVNNYGMLYGSARNDIFSYHPFPISEPNSFGNSGAFTGVFDTSLGAQSNYDNRKNPDGSWRLRPGSPIVDRVPVDREAYYR